MKKFESERNALFSVILGLVPRIHAKHLSSVILGFIPRIHTKHSSLDTRVKPEYDKGLMVDTRVKTEYDGKRSLIKGWDVVRQCAALLERRVQSSTRVRKAQAVTRQTNPIGRSMIEMLGVLAIIGVLSVGGIAGYSKAMETYKINQTKRHLTEIITNIQTLYMQQKDFNGLSNASAVEMNVIPDDLTISDQEDPNIFDTFGSFINITNNTSSFMVSFMYMPKEECMALATTDWGTASNGLVGAWVGNISGYDFRYYNEELNKLNSEEKSANYYHIAKVSRLPISPANAAKICGVPGLNNFLGFGLKFSK